MSKVTFINHNNYIKDTGVAWHIAMDQETVNKMFMSRGSFSINEFALTTLVFRWLYP